MTRQRTITAASLAVLAASAGLLVAGPLNPPAGSIAPTYKTLTEVEPRTAINATNTPGDADSLFKITQPGSYYLTGNITGVIGKHGIEITSSGVTLDLNGFELRGVSDMGAFDGVTASTANLNSVCIRNGTVRGWGDEGVDFRATIVANASLKDITASENGGDGLAAGFGNIVSHCLSYDNDGHGFSSANATVLTECIATSNALSGFSLISDCMISQCTTRGNTLDGIRVENRCFVLNNTSSNNGITGVGAGIHVLGFDNRLEANLCSGSDFGIDVDFAGNIIIRNTCSGNTTNWNIAANNIFGPIIDRTAPASAAVTGNAAAGTLGTIDANANFSY
jgi:parallel beta-helix repeat protein